METQDHKNPVLPEEKDVERIISRKSSSGVGRSDRSARSEDELFTDAVTEFNETPAIIREASGGGMQRFYSMENVNVFGVENHIGGADILGETDLLMDNQLQTFLNVDAEEDKVKAGVASTDVMPGIENSAGHEIVHTSEPAREDVLSRKSEESISTNDKPEHKTSYTEIPKGVADKFCGLEDNNERLNVLDSANSDKIENCSEVDSPGNLDSPVLQGDAEKSGDSNVNKSRLVEGCDSEIGANENVNNLAIPDVLPLEQRPEIEVIFTKTTDSDILISEDDNVSYSEDKQSAGVQKTFGETNHTSDVNSANANSGMFKSDIINDGISGILENRNDTGIGEKTPITIFPEGATMVSGETTSYANTIRSNIEDDGEYVTVVNNDCSKVSEDDLVVKNLAFISPGVEEIERSDKNVRKEDCMADNGNGATLKTDEINSASKVDVDVDEDKDADHIIEGDRESKHHVTVTAIDSNVNTGSLADSLDGNWGSGSDAIPTSDTIGSTHSQSLEREEIPSVVSNPLIEKHQSQYQVAPMSAVGTEHIERAPEIYSSNEANRGNKGKEIMTEDSGNQNIPLKTLLGEATATSRAESPIHHNPSSTSTSTSTSVPQRDNGNLDKTENLSMGKEWNSPARYPVKIKTEKKRSKSKPYWSSFLCCSSVNAR